MSEIKNDGKVVEVVNKTKESKFKTAVSKIGESIKKNRKKIIVAGVAIVGAGVGIYLVKNKLNLDVEVLDDVADTIDVSDCAEVIADAE